MKQNLITDIVQGMLPYLNNAQSKRLQEVLQHTLVNYEVIEDTLYDVGLPTINEHTKKYTRIVNWKRPQLFGISE